MTSYNYKSTKAFEKDFKKLSTKDKDITLNTIKLLLERDILPKSCRPHALIGNYKGFMELHVKPDLLLIYKIIEDKNTIILERINTHSELFKK